MFVSLTFKGLHVITLIKIALTSLMVMHVAITSSLEGTQLLAIHEATEKVVLFSLRVSH